MPRQRFDVDVPEGMHLSVSRQVDGGFSALLRDDHTNEVVTHAVLLTPDDPQWSADEPESQPWFDGNGSTLAEDDELAEAIAAIVTTVAAVAGAYAVGRAAPHVRAWWDDKAAPRLDGVRDRVRNRFGKQRRDGRAGGGSELAGVLPEYQPIGEHTAGGDLEPADPVHEMTRAEAEQLLADAVMAMAFAQEQLQVLRNTRVVDGDGAAELERTLRELTPEQVEEATRQLMQVNPGLLESRLLESGLRRLGSGHENTEPVVLVARPVRADDSEPPRS